MISNHCIFHEMLQNIKNIKKVSNLSMVKPEKAEMIENKIIQQHSQGMFSTKVSESHVKRLLETQSKNESKNKSKITFKRKVCADDEDIDVNDLWSDDD